MISQSVFDFLKSLSENNSREWFHENRKWYEDSKKEVEAFVTELINDIRIIDPGIGQIELKNCMFRIHRDIRFSNDKRPYKQNFGASISKSGRKFIAAGYYFHIEPNASFLAGGIYMPPAEILKKIRMEILYDFKEFKEIIENKNYKNYFGGIFGEKLSRLPKDFKDIPADFPGIECLKYKSITAFAPIDDKQMMSKDIKSYILKRYEIIKPLNDFINRSLQSGNF